MALSCNKNYLLPYSATFMVPSEFGFEDSDKFSIAISTKNLIAYKTIVEEEIQDVPVVCDKIIPSLKVKVAQVNLSGSIVFRVAANGVKTDEIVLDPSIPDPVPTVTFEPAWSSADGISSIEDPVTHASYITIAYIPADEEIVGTPYKVYLYSMEVSHIGEDPASDDKTVTISGYFRIIYDPVD